MKRGAVLALALGCLVAAGAWGPNGGLSSLRTAELPLQVRPLAGGRAAQPGTPGGARPGTGTAPRGARRCGEAV
jgi:hypothetical protein